MLTGARCCEMRRWCRPPPRQLESLVRLSEALARMRLAPTVEAADVAEALRLMRARPARLALRKGCMPAISKAHACVTGACMLRLASDCTAYLWLQAACSVSVKVGEAGMAEEAETLVLCRHVQGALQQAATDPVTGAIDMDKILTGTSAAERTARAQLAQELTALLLSARPPRHGAAARSAG